MAQYENLDLEVSEYIATIRLNRPPVNALSMGLYLDIAAVFGEIAGRTDEIRVAEVAHGPVGARRYEYLPTWMIRGLTQLNLEFTGTR